MLLGFNTSHVTLYRQSISLLHLYLKFQYISCYSLSIIETLWNVKKFVSIHLMLLFIGYGEQELDTVIFVSIHLMLLFIESVFQRLSENSSFNTSHVTLYRKHTYSAWLQEESFNTSHVTLYRIPAANMQT